MCLIDKPSTPAHGNWIENEGSWKGLRGSLMEALIVKVDKSGRDHLFVSEVVW